MSKLSERKGRRLFEALFAFALCLVNYVLVGALSIYAPMFLGGPAMRAFVAYVLMPVDILVLGWQQPPRVLIVHVAAVVAAFALGRGGSHRQYQTMLVAFVTSALVSALHEASTAHARRPA